MLCLHITLSCLHFQKKFQYICLKNTNHNGLVELHPLKVNSVFYFPTLNLNSNFPHFIICVIQNPIGSMQFLPFLLNKIDHSVNIPKILSYTFVCCRQCRKFGISGNGITCNRGVSDIAQALTGNAGLLILPATYICI